VAEHSPDTTARTSFADEAGLARGGTAAPAPGAEARGARLAVVGLSIRATCGVRDHATLLARSLERDGATVTMHWLTRSRSPLPGARRELASWGAQLADELRAAQPAAVLLHYSPFSYAHRGVPVFVRGVLAAIGRARVPILCVAHELAYPWGRGGVRGRTWAISQRAALRELVKASAGVLVTADFQRDWLVRSRWLPSRPTLMAPVFSNLPPPQAARPGGGPGELIGVFGYDYQGSEMEVVLDALALLRTRGAGLRLALLGAPGRESAAAERWLGAAAARRLEGLIEFHGPLPAQQLSDALAGCDVLVSCARLGPSSRKGTLAGSLASGAPVVALDGPLRWEELVEAHAAEVVAPTPRALADALAALLGDRLRRSALGQRGRAFAESSMSVARTRDAVLTLLAGLGVSTPPLSRSASG
jgi:glycosyltransferase involved in cell wall biosynthesis